MNSPVDDQLELLALSNEEFADGLARMVKAFTSHKEQKKADSLLYYPSGSSSGGNNLLLEDNTPLNLE